MGLGLNVNGSNDEEKFDGSTGAIMGFQIPLLVIDRRVVSVMSGVFPNRRVTHLRVYDA